MGNPVGANSREEARAALASAASKVERLQLALRQVMDSLAEAEEEREAAETEFHRWVLSTAELQQRVEAPPR